MPRNAAALLGSGALPLVTNIHRRKRPSFWTVRNLFYQTHLWLGLILGLYLMMMGFTGSLLVFGREIDRWLNPHLWNVEVKGQRLPLSQILSSFEQRYPDWKGRYTYINFPVEANHPYTIRLGPNRASQVDVFLDPYTGAILGDRTRTSSFYGFLCYLHFYLFLGQAGWLLNGWGAVLALPMLFSGIWLWWPAMRAGRAVWKARFSVRTDAGVSRALYDVHNAAGVYPFLFSLLVAVTAMEFAFPEPVASLVYGLTGTAAATRLTVPKPGRQRLPVDVLVAAADQALVGRIRRVSFPRTPEVPLMVRKEWGDWNRTRNHANIAVDPFSGRVLSIEDTRDAPLARKLIQWCIPIHFGIWGGLTTRIVYVFLGLAWVAAFVTGFWHWILRRVRRNRPSSRCPSAA
ncbi:MAG: PepSY domain-containing protein [Acidobacteriales bacterium]|nr:PepSY domain-containing protein [Terriglobales bacterium]